jgi:UDP-N-acetylglucosamine 2-epimerase
MKKKKIFFVFGTRPEALKLARLFWLRNQSALSPLLLHWTAS